jgi:hypothetical protein
MPQMNPGQTRVVDPILSEHARGYRQAGLVGQALFPRAPVASYGGKVIEFGKEAFKLYSSKRAPGSATKRIRFGYDGRPYSIQPSALESPVPRELMRDASQVPGIDLAKRAVNLTLRSLQLEHEDACAKIARNAANYDNDHKVALAGADRWTSETSTPVADVDNGKEAVRQSIGIRPNTLLLSSVAATALKRHPDLLARASLTGIKVVNEQLLSVVFDIPRIVIGEAIVADDADAFGDVWGADVILAYVGADVNVNANMEEPSFGYTYVIEGHPAVEEPYWDANTKSWIYGTSYDNSPVLCGMAAGYLIQNAGAPAA